MKKLFTIFAIAISAISFAQPVGIKLNSPKEFITRPALTVNADSIFSKQTDGGTYVSSIIFFYKNGEPVGMPMNIVLWDGDEYKQNENWTNATVIARIKELLDIQK